VRVEEEKRKLKARTIASTRHNRFGGTFVLKNLQVNTGKLQNLFAFFEEKLNKFLDQLNISRMSGIRHYRPAGYPGTVSFLT
jgi:hypothetical protein